MLSLSKIPPPPPPLEGAFPYQGEESGFFKKLKQGVKGLTDVKIQREFGEDDEGYAIGETLEERLEGEGKKERLEEVNVRLETELQEIQEEGED